MKVVLLITHYNVYLYAIYLFTSHIVHYEEYHNPILTDTGLQEMSR